MGETAPDEVPTPAPPRLPESMGTEVDPDLDPRYPDLDGVDLEGVVVSQPGAASLTVLRCRLRGVELALDETTTIDAQDAHLCDLDLSGRRIEAAKRVVFERCRLTGADFGETRLTDVRFLDCALDLASWRAATLERVEVDDGRITELDCSGAELTDCRLRGVPLAGVELGGCRFRRVDLSGADLHGLEDLTVLRGTSISITQAVSVAPLLARAVGIRVTTVGS